MNKKIFLVFLGLFLIFGFWAIMPFTNIANAQTIQVTAPNGGECLTAGNAYAVSWSMSGVDHADVYYSNTGNEANKTSIIHAVPGQTAYAFFIPSIDTSTGKIFIYGHNASEAILTSDSSDGYYYVMQNCGGGGSDLVGHWKFDGNGNNEVSGKPGAVTMGNAVFNSSGGRIGGYGYIPSSSDSFRIPHDSAYNLPSFFTVSFWFKQRSNQ